MKFISKHNMYIPIGYRCDYAYPLVDHSYYDL